MNVGYSKVKITPDIGVVMGGHPGEKKAQSVLTELYARSMAIDDGETLVVFSSADVLFVGDESVARIKKAVREKTGLCPDNIFISATHTHSGPLTTGLFGKASQGGYVAVLEERIAKSITDAVNSLSSAKLYYFSDFVENMAFCARFVMRGGRIETHPFKDDRQIICPEGVPDKQLNVLFSCDDGGRIMGMLLNFAQHPQIMERESTAISADFPAYTERYIQSVLGADIPVLFVNGPCGDVCPVNAQDKESCEVGAGWCEKYGFALGKAVIKGLSEKKEITGKIKIKTASVALRLRRVDRAKIKNAKAFLKAAEGKSFPEPKVSNYGVEGGSGQAVSLERYLSLDCWKVQEYADILYLERQRKISKKQTIGISAVRLGGLGIVALPFEVFAKVGLDIKERSGFDKTAIFELTNGNAGYLPTPGAFERSGGYETLTLYSSRFEKKSADIVVKKAVELLNEVME